MESKWAIKRGLRNEYYCGYVAPNGAIFKKTSEYIPDIVTWGTKEDLIEDMQLLDIFGKQVALEDQDEHTQLVYDAIKKGDIIEIVEIIIPT